MKVKAKAGVDADIYLIILIAASIHGWNELENAVCLCVYVFMIITNCVFAISNYLSYDVFLCIGITISFITQHQI